MLDLIYHFKLAISRIRVSFKDIWRLERPSAMHQPANHLFLSLSWCVANISGTDIGPVDFLILAVNAEEPHVEIKRHGGIDGVPFASHLFPSLRTI